MVRGRVLLWQMASTRLVGAIALSNGGSRCLIADDRSELRGHATIGRLDLSGSFSPSWRLVPICRAHAKRPSPETHELR
jgi:hypothetical protein